MDHKKIAYEIIATARSCYSKSAMSKPCSVKALILKLKIDKSGMVDRVIMLSHSKYHLKNIELLDVQLCFRRFPIDGFSGKWWSK